MPRPQVSEDHRDRLEELVDEDTELPASALTFDEQLDYLLETYQSLKIRNERLEENLNKTKRELEEARADEAPSPRSTGSNRRGR